MEEKADFIAIRCRCPGCKTRQSKENKFSACSRCGAKYCSRACQVKDWKLTHKLICQDKKKNQEAKALNDNLECTKVEAHITDEEAILSVLNRLMAYTAPFAVFQFEQQAKGVLFVQTQQDLKEFRYTGKINEHKEMLDRVVICHYINETELEEDVMPNIPELEKHKGYWRAALRKYKPKSQVVLLIKTGCGWTHCITVPLEPTYQMCLGAIQDNLAMYENMDQLELRMDKDL